MNNLRGKYSSQFYNKKTAPEVFHKPERLWNTSVFLRHIFKLPMPCCSAYCVPGMEELRKIGRKFDWKRLFAAKIYQFLPITNQFLRPK